MGLQRYGFFSELKIVTNFFPIFLLFALAEQGVVPLSVDNKAHSLAIRGVQMAVSHADISFGAPHRSC